MLRAVVWALVAVLALLVAMPMRVSAAPASERPTVVFIAPLQLSADTQSALEDALTTQLSLLPAALEFEVRAQADLAVPERLQAAKQAAQQHHAIALFWLEVREPGPWLLYAADAAADRIVVRPLASPGTSPEAAVEAIALIVRATTDALIHGEPLPAATGASSNLDKTNSAPWPVVEARESSKLRIAGGYVGTTFAKQLPWQHGFLLRAAWLWPTGPYVGLGFTFVPTSTFNIAPVRFTIDRYPISVHAGLRFPVSRFTFSGELGFEIEPRTRKTLSAAGLYDPGPEARKTIFNVCPKLEAEYTVVSWFRLFVGVGVDLVIGNFSYATKQKSMEMTESTVLLEPHSARLSAQAGIALVQ